MSNTELVSWVREMGQGRIRWLASSLMSAVRRHPFQGYQWQVMTGRELLEGDVTGWSGSEWEYGSAAEAINAANEVLTRDGQEIDWIYIAA